MADLRKIQVGDKLKVELTVTQLDLSDSRQPVEAEERYWLESSAVEAAEHIPAPRVFKRGDWVRYRPAGARHGFVAYVDPSAIWVAWPDEPRTTPHVPNRLEPDEAPE